MARSRPAWWLVLGAASFVAYFILLIYCDIFRPETVVEGVAPGPVGLIVQGVAPESRAARAGLTIGDEIVAANGLAIHTRSEWMAIEINVSFDQPLVLEVRRGANRLVFVVPRVPDSLAYFATREGIELLITRAAQLITLILGLVIVFRRPFDSAARLGAWLLTAAGVFCVVLPYRIADVWRHLPWPAGIALWLPLVSTHLVPVLLLTFFMTFPNRRVRSAALWAAIWMPGVIVAAIYARFEIAMVYSPRAPLPPDGFGPIVAVSSGYLIATLIAAIVNYRTLRDPNERRRFRVLMLGGVGGGLSAAVIFVAFWHSAQISLFASPVSGLAALTLLTLPMSFAYAILRHRLFDVRLMVRQGVRYALARGLLLSLVPAMLAVLALDVYSHRSEAVAQLFVARAVLYVLLAAAAVLLQYQHQKWLDALDRRFFRERYDAQRLLRGLAEEIRDSSTFENAAAHVVVQIDRALHPRWVSVLVLSAREESYRLIAATPAGCGPDKLDMNSKLAALAAVLGKPFDVSAAGSGWLADHLPEQEAARVRDWGLELLVPISFAGDRPDGLLALGARRSEEPYAEEDTDLLATIAANLALVLSRNRESAPRAATFEECPGCGTCYEAGVSMCAEDGKELSVVRLPRLLVGRYRLRRRLGQGGMGVVYQADDVVLEREVAVKVLREDLPRDPESSLRFRLEARVSAGFAHPNVVTIYDFGLTDDSRAFLVMERLTGATLRDALKRDGPFHTPRVLAVIRAVCSAVDAAHRRGLVHRDLKPENIFLARADGLETPKVLDFGIAKFVPEAAAVSRHETAVGLMVGTPQYMAPEQLRGEDPHVSWDVWALGVMTYEMLTGSHPFCTSAFAITADTLPRHHTAVVSGVGSKLGPRWERFFTRALAIECNRRAATAPEFLRELEAAVTLE